MMQNYFRRDVTADSQNGGLLCAVRRLFFGKMWKMQLESVHRGVTGGSEGKIIIQFREGESRDQVKTVAWRR